MNEIIFIFRYGIKEIVLKTNMVYVSLLYSPKYQTLKNKFGNLSLTYLRMNIDNDMELVLFEKALEKYIFNIGRGNEQVLQSKGKKAFIKRK